MPFFPLTENSKQAQPTFSLSSVNTTLKDLPNNRLFSLPFEIRQEIFFWTLVLQALHHDTYVGFSSQRPGPVIYFYPAERNSTSQQGGYVAFWGSKQMASIFPVCSQWYDEIQEVLYSLFTFEIFGSLFERPGDHPLDFLPSQALPLIRSINIVVDTDILHDIERKILLQQKCNELASRLTGVNDTCIVIHLYKPVKEFNNTSKDAVQGRFDDILAVCRPFRHVSKLQIWADHRVVPCKEIIAKCQRS